MKKKLFLVVTFFLIACGASESKRDLIKSRAKETSEVATLLEIFNAQQHRIELNRCQMLYNNTPFHVGMSVRELTEIFGPYQIYDQGLYVWPDVGIGFFVRRSEGENVAAPVDTLIIYLEESKKESSAAEKQHWRVTKSDYLLIEGVPITKNTPFKDFVARSNFQLSDFYIDNYSYELHYKCGSSKKLVYLLGAKGGWLYKGTGHLMMKSEPNPDNKNIIDAINVFESEH